MDFHSCPYENVVHVFQGGSPFVKFEDESSVMAHSRAHRPASSNGVQTKYLDEPSASAPEPESESLSDVVVKTSSKLISELLKQLVEFTSATSSGSAKVISTHCSISQHTSSTIF